MIRFNEDRIVPETQLRHTNDTGQPESALSTEQAADLARLLTQLQEDEAQ
jgi:hypothetical protein